MNGRPWTDEDSQFLRENIDKMPIEALSEQMGRAACMVRNYAIKLGIYDKRTTTREIAWTEQQRNFLRDNISEMTINAIQGKLCKSYSGVKYQAKLMGIWRKRKKTPQTNRYVKPVRFKLSKQEHAKQKGIMLFLAAMRTARNKHPNIKTELDMKIFKREYQNFVSREEAVCDAQFADVS